MISLASKIHLPGLENPFTGPENLTMNFFVDSSINVVYENCKTFAGRQEAEIFIRRPLLFFRWPPSKTSKTPRGVFRTRTTCQSSMEESNMSKKIKEF